MYTESGSPPDYVKKCKERINKNIDRKTDDKGCGACCKKSANTKSWRCAATNKCRFLRKDRPPGGGGAAPLFCAARWPPCLRLFCCGLLTSLFFHWLKFGGDTRQQKRQRKARTSACRQSDVHNASAARRLGKIATVSQNAKRTCLLGTGFLLVRTKPGKAPGKDDLLNLDIKEKKENVEKHS
ncbi:hypothetical protein TW95_gp1490 [Pandoravirus inopinatum]|uniref:Uncharacterized protein n=1 Tax=Pandoravirus inopinatum TaxID=1605721 RepID=A0A0B5J3R5_9VIRU|nr:hypothetical protein TW95_gp1490 [Pandoravirus inopinatum]AJF98224.1 hypothetical protein [Pandoravirus inopinatum]